MTKELQDAMWDAQLALERMRRIIEAKADDDALTRMERELVDAAERHRLPRHAQTLGELARAGLIVFDMHPDWSMARIADAAARVVAVHNEMDRPTTRKRSSGKKRRAKR